MKKLGKLLLIVVLSISTLNGATGIKIFDLKEQVFDELSKNTINTYKVKNALVKLKLLYHDKGYFGDADRGETYISIKPDKKLTNWVLDEDYWILNVNEERTIKFISTNSTIINLTFKGQYIYINDFKYSFNAMNRIHNIKIVKNNKILNLYINGIKIYATQTKFDKLDEIEQYLYSGNGHDGLYGYKLWEIK